MYYLPDDNNPRPGQHLTTVLQSETGEAGVLVHPDHPVTQTSHTEDTSTCGIDALPARPPDTDGQTFSGGCTRADGVWSEALRLEH